MASTEQYSASGRRRRCKLAADADPGVGDDLVSMLRNGADRAGGRAFHFVGDESGAGSHEQISMIDLVERASCVATGLRNLGVRPGDRIALFAKPDVDYVTMMVAALWSGCVAAPINHLFKLRELSSYLAVTSPMVVFAGAETMARASEALSSNVKRSMTVGTDSVSGADTTVAALATHPRSAPVHRDSEDPAFILHTSGTTGLPKGVVRSNGAYAHLVDLWTRRYMADGDVVVNFMPLYHQAGLLLSLLPTLALGNSIHQLERFSTETFWARADLVGATWSVLMPPSPSFLLAANATSTTEPEQNSFEWVMTGGRIDHWSELQQRFDVVGHSGYGSTETTMVTMTGTRDDAEAGESILGGALGGFACGVPIAGWNELRVVRDNGSLVDSLEIGEIEIRGPGVFSEYFGNADATAQAFTAGGWYRPGDVGYWDDAGQLFMVDRSSNLIRRSGENISPGEIEQVLLEHPHVAEAAVVPVVDDLRGQEIRACIVMRDDVVVDPAAIFEFSAERLSRFKVPRYLDVRQALPMTATFKVRKDVLVAESEPAVWVDRVASFKQPLA